MVKNIKQYQILEISLSINLISFLIFKQFYSSKKQKMFFKCQRHKLGKKYR